MATGHELAEGTPSRALVAKLTSLGAPASGWGTYGFVHADVRGTAHAVVQDGASQVIAGVDRGMGFAMRIDEGGRLVPSYGYSGIARFSIADDGTGTIVRDAVVLSDRRVMLVGSAIEQGRDSDGAIFLRKRYGDFDATYSLGANALFPLGGSDDAFFAAALSPDQRTVAVVGSGGAHAVIYLAPTK